MFHKLLSHASATKAVKTLFRHITVGIDGKITTSTYCINLVSLYQYDQRGEHVNVQEESDMAILDSRFYSESYLLMSTCGLYDALSGQFFRYLLL